MGATGLLLASTGIQAGSGILGSIAQSKAQKEQGRYEEQIAESNARMAELNAEDALLRGGRESNKVRRQGRLIQGAQRASFAGQGVDVNSGSAADIQDETAVMSETDALTVQNNAWREAWGYKAQASNYRYEGKFARLAAKNESRNTLLTGGLRFAGDLARGAYLYKQSR